MKIFLHFSNSSYNCDIIIKDAAGTRNYSVNLAEVEEGCSESLEVDVENGNFELTVIPKMSDYESLLAEMDNKSLKDKLAKKIGNSFLTMVDNLLLRVGCKYNISGLSDGDVISLCQQDYAFGMFNSFDWFELIPLAYMFFEAYCGGCRCELSDAFETNRRQTLSFSRKIALIDFGWQLLITYPIQIGRIKRLTSNKKIKRTLVKFNQMDEEQRRQVLDRKEKFMV